MTDTTIAFAGMLQASELVRQIATSGNCSQQAARTSLGSIFELSPDSTAAVYGGLGGVRLGLTLITELFGGQSNPDNLQSLNYALGLVKLGLLIERDGERQAKLGRELGLIESAWTEGGETLDDSVLSQLADVYERHVSTLSFRLSITGRPEYLKQAEKVAFIRALLLAGIRSAFLWRQTGGRQWRLIFQRHRLLKDAESLLRA